MRVGLFVAAAAALALAAFSFGRGQRSAPDASDGAKAAAEAELKALRAETERLRQDVQELQGRQPAATGRPGADPLRPQAPHDSSAQPPAAAADAVAEKTPEQERDDMLRYAKYLDDQLARSPQREDALAGEVKAKITGLLDEKSALLELQCGEQLCRMTTRHKDSEAYRAFQSKAFLGSAIEPKARVWTGPLSFVVLERPETPEQPLVVATYMGRGEAMPSPEPAR